jgi:peptidoglycan hydrolase-like protein with peptidoglycan-binding domain
MVVVFRNLTGYALCLVLLLSMAPLLQSAKKKTARSSTSKITAVSTKSKTPSKAKAAPRATASKAKPKANASKKSSSTKRRTTQRKARAAQPKSNWRTVQRQPTRERYSEIQEALIQRGYLSGGATGDWGTDSVEALRRFQADHELDATGKINSLSLIALGLGPKREGKLSTSGAPIPLEGAQ